MLKLDPNADVGSVQAGLNQYNHKIIVATRQSLSHKKSQRLEKMLENGNEFELIVIDEAHLAVGQIKKIIDKLNKNIKVIGFTATPFNKELKDIFAEVNYSKSLLEMIKQGFLCQPKAIKIDTDTDLSNVKTVAGDFSQGALEDEINTPERNLMVVEAWKKYASDREHTIVFCGGVDHSNAIADCFNDNGIACKTIDGKTDKDNRKEILESFKNGDFPVVCNCMVLTTGFDFEKLPCVILAAPTKSKTKYLQQIGRGLRVADGKSDCLIIDMCDTCKNHDIMNMDDIFGVTIKSGETLKEAIERNELEKEEEVERQRLREEAEKQRELELQELMATEIDLFNANLGAALDEKSYYDWWKVDQNCYALSQTTDFHYVVEKKGNMFNCYEVNSMKDHNEIEMISTAESVLDAIELIESQIGHITSFMVKQSKWKNEPATAAQLRAIKWRDIHSKMDAHVYFSGWKIKQIMKSMKMAG